MDDSARVEAGKDKWIAVEPMESVGAMAIKIVDLWRCLGLVAVEDFRIDCACPERGSGESDVLAALNNAVEEGLGELSIVQDLAPSLERLVGREDDRATLEATLVDDTVEHVGCGT